MRTFVKIIFYIGFLFFGGGFLVGLFQYFAYNGFGNVFEYTKPEYVETSVTIDSTKNTKTISYIYWVNKKEYSSKESVAINKIQKYDFYETNIYYNKHIPSLSYVGSYKLKLRSPVMGMIIMGCFFLLILSMYIFGDMDKCIAIYQGGNIKNNKK